MDFKIGQLVLPGDAIGRLTGMTGELKLGSGILQNKEELIAIKTGVLQHLPPNMYWIDSCQKRVRLSSSLLSSLSSLSSVLSPLSSLTKEGAISVRSCDR